MSYKIKDEFKIVRIQTLDLFEKLKPINIHIRDSETNTKLAQYFGSRRKYCFILNSLWISSSVVPDTNVIYLICSGLSDPRDLIYCRFNLRGLINGKLYKTLGVVNIGKIWEKNKSTIKMGKHCFQWSRKSINCKIFRICF